MKRKRANKEGEKESKREKRRNPFRFLAWGAFFPILAEAGIGILLLALPENSLEVLSISVGVLFCVLAVFLLATAFLHAKAGILRLAFGAAFIGAAVWLFIGRSEAAVILLYILLGLLILRTLLGMWNALSRNKELTGRRRREIGFTVCLALFICAFVLFFPIFSFTVRCIVTGVLYVILAATGLCSRFARLFAPKPLPEAVEKKGEKQEEKKMKRGKEKEHPEAQPPQEPQAQEEPREPEKKRRSFFGRKKKSDEDEGQ